MPGSHDYRSRSVKPATVHGCAQSGDFAGFQKCLHDNPSLLNARNAVMSQTPLHVAVAYNNTEIVKFLLEWKGDEKVDLEAKNLDDETPLHVAAKNGCSEPARLLLVNDASLEAKTKNGMTPLHLAVLHALRTEDCSIVSTLLEHNANCNVKDNEGKTPLDHGASSERLQAIFFKHKEVQRSLKAIESCGKTKAKVDEFEKAISSMVGLHKLKLQLHKWATGMLFDEKRRALGFHIAPRRLPHMAFLGNPGTGKTMVARVLGKLLHMIGILSTDKVTEVQRTDLVAEFLGQTRPKTRRKIREAEGGILFIDEAYRLIMTQTTNLQDYGLEALEEIMSVMDSGKLVVIFAGYPKPMKRVIRSNEGFARRVTKFFYFDDFSTTELAEILHFKMENQDQNSSIYGFKLHPSCSIPAIAELIESEITEKQRKEMNGGLIDPLLANAREMLDLRLDFNSVDIDGIVTLTMDDLGEGLRLLALVDDSDDSDDADDADDADDSDDADESSR